MKKVFKIMVVLLLVLGAFCLGHDKGVQDVRLNQIIYDENHNEGTYYAEYNGRIDEYWYER